MKRALFLSIVAGLVVQPVFADTRTSGHENLGVGGGALVGAVAGGPVGAIIGAAIGGHYGHSVKQSAKVAPLQASLAAERGHLASARGELSDLADRMRQAGRDVEVLNREIAQLVMEQAAVAGLQIDVLYRTGESAPDEQARTRIERLAALMTRVPDLVAQLDGFADPRGSDDYNARLAAERAHGVRELLIAAGVDAARIQTASYGESMAKADSDDRDSQALERRVTIQLERDPALARDRHSEIERVANRK